MTNEERALGYLKQPPLYGTGQERYTPAQNKRLRHKAHARKTHTHTVPEFNSPGSNPRFTRVPGFRCPRCSPESTTEAQR